LIQGQLGLGYFLKNASKEIVQRLIRNTTRVHLPVSPKTKELDRC